MLSLLLLLACPSADTEATGDTAPTVVPWSAGLPSTDDQATLRGLQPRRGIIHLHSPWSHDACDSEGYVDGTLDQDCFDDLREALCTTRMDFAMVTDHPDYADRSVFEEWLQPRDEDTVLDAAVRSSCDDHEVLWLPGFEDELMPVGLSRHVDDDPDERHRLLNQTDAEAMDAMTEAGALVFRAHTEGRTREELVELVELGLTGVELFNLHAMFAPDIRSEDLGLGPLDYLAEMAPFTDEDASAEPDLLFLAVLQEQPPSIAHWDALQELGLVVGIGGTDAHQNTLPIVLRDGERGDSYRRMVRWFSNWVYVDGELTPESLDAALTAGRVAVVFEVLGTPDGLDVHLQSDDGTTVEMGGSGSAGTLSVGCVGLTGTSPTDGQAPEIDVTVFKDGAEWATGCGEHTTDGAGSYRVRYDLTPRHLEGFLGEEPEVWIERYPWIYTNPIRVTN